MISQLVTAGILTASDATHARLSSIPTPTYFSSATARSSAITAPTAAMPAATKLKTWPSLLAIKLSAPRVSVVATASAKLRISDMRGHHRESSVWAATKH